jgi:hypothetical protein
MLLPLQDLDNLDLLMIVIFFILLTLSHSQPGKVYEACHSVSQFLTLRGLQFPSDSH